MTKTLKKHLKIILLALAVIILALFIINSQTENPKIENYPQQSLNPTLKNDSLATERSQKVMSAINSALKNTQGRYGIFLKDLKNNQTFEQNSAEIFTSASIYKLAIMYKTFDALEKGEIKENDNLDETLRLMITISDNDSAILLAEKFGWANIENFLIEVGIKNFKLATKTEATAQSTAQILERIYRGQAVSKQASNKMRKLLLGQTKNDRIPKYLPQNTKVAHKTGELDTLRHDAGIVYGKKSDYIFVFFSDTPTPEDASETIAKLAKSIFDMLETP